MELKYSDITEKIIGCAMKMHSKMGPGYPGIIYARSLTNNQSKNPDNPWL